jgi:hypothetical protein
VKRLCCFGRAAVMKIHSAYMMTINTHPNSFLHNITIFRSYRAGWGFLARRQQHLWEFGAVPVL